MKTLIPGEFDIFRSVNYNEGGSVEFHVVDDDDRTLIVFSLSEMECIAKADALTFSKFEDVETLDAINVRGVENEFQEKVRKALRSWWNLLSENWGG